MPNIDSREFKQGVLEIYEELGMKIKFYPLDPNQATNIYGETKTKKYLDPIELPGIVKPSTKQDFANSGNSLVTITLNLEIPTKAMETHSVTSSDLLKGKIIFNNQDFWVYDVTPKSVFLGDHPAYNVQCRQVVK